MNETIETIAAHRSIRRFEPSPLPREVVRAAVEAAQQASTSSNVQAYSCLWVRDAGKRAALAELCGDQSQVERAGAFFVVAGDLRRHRAVADAKGVPCRANLETFLLAAVDASLFAQNLALAFESTGHGVCFIGGLRLALPEVDRLLEIPDGVLPFYGLCAGKPAEDPGRRPRLPLDAVLFEDRYPSREEVERGIAAYDETMAAYYERRGKPGHDWSGGIARKFAERRRDHLADYYASKGARLD
jgi:FMN reductase (NADPH)